MKSFLRRPLVLSCCRYLAALIAAATLISAATGVVRATSPITLSDSITFISDTTNDQCIATGNAGTVTLPFTTIGTFYFYSSITIDYNGTSSELDILDTSPSGGGNAPVTYNPGAVSVVSGSGSYAVSLAGTASSTYGSYLYGGTYPDVGGTFNSPFSGSDSFTLGHSMFTMFLEGYYGISTAGGSDTISFTFTAQP